MRESMKILIASDKKTEIYSTLFGYMKQFDYVLHEMTDKYEIGRAHV